MTRFRRKSAALNLVRIIPVWHKISDLFSLCRSDISRLLIRFYISFFLPPLLNFRLSELLHLLPHRQDIIPENTAISLCILPPSTVSPFTTGYFFAVIRTFSSLTLIPETPPYSYPRALPLQKYSLSERNHTRRLQSEPFRIFSKSKLADKEVIDCAMSPKGKVCDALHPCKASSSCHAPPFLANRARSDITEKSFGNSPALLRFTKPPKKHYSNNSCSESEYYYGL